MKKNTNFTTITVASYKNVVEAKAIFAEFRSVKIDRDRWKKIIGWVRSGMIFIVYLLAVKYTPVVDLIINLQSTIGVMGVLLEIVIVVAAIMFLVLPAFNAELDDSGFVKNDNDKDVIKVINWCEGILDTIFPFESGYYYLNFWGNYGVLIFKFNFNDKKDKFSELSIDSEGQIKIVEIENENVADTDAKEEVIIDTWQIFLSELEEKTGYKHFELTDGNKIRAWGDYNPADGEVKEEHFLLQY